MAKNDKQTDKKPSASDRMMEIAGSYWRLILTSIALGLAVYLLALLGPIIGITVPTIYFMPTLYVIAIAFVRDPRKDQLMSFTYALFTGFIFMVLISFITPYLSALLSGG